MNRCKLLLIQESDLFHVWTEVFVNLVLIIAYINHTNNIVHFLGDHNLISNPFLKKTIVKKLCIMYFFNCILP